MKNIFKICAMVCLAALSTAAQITSGNIGSNSSPVVGRRGQPMPGVNIAICQPAVASFSINGNLANLTLSLPIGVTASSVGFAPGMQIIIFGFSGADSFINAGSLANGVLSGGYQILSVAGQNITFAITHANANSSTFGSVVQQGNVATPCASQTQVYADPLLSVPLTQPIISDQLGNWNVFAAPGIYYVQFYGSNVETTVKQIVVGIGSPSLLPLSNLWTGLTNTFLNGILSGSPALPVPAGQAPFTVGDCVNVTSTAPLIFGDAGLCNAGGGSGTVVASPQFQFGSFPTSGTAATIQGNNITTDATGNNLNVPGNISVKGPNPYFGIDQYGARAVVINTNGTGSGTSLTVGVTSFKTGDGIAVVGGGNAPAIAAPTAPAVVTGAAGGPTVPDAVMVAGMTNASAYNYAIFAEDVLGGATVPVTVSTSTGPTTLGKTSFTVSTWSLTGNTLTITTNSSSGLPIGTWIHITGTSNNALAGGWYPISSISGSIITLNNVPQFAATTTAGTGGTVVAFVGNTLTWTRSAGGTIGTTNVPWRYFVCAQRPGDGALHIIGSSLPSTFYAESNGGNFSNTFVDFGSTLSANPVVPWYFSDANCTAGAAQNEVFSTTVSAGGGTTGLTLANALPNAVTGAAVRQDNAPALVAAANAVGSKGTVFIPNSAGFSINSFALLPFSINIQQNGPITVNDTILVQGSTNWYGTGSGPTPAFGFNGASVITCNAWPCIYVAGVANQATGGTTFDTLSFASTQNGLEMLVDANWGMVWHKINFQSGLNNNDNMGMDLVIRLGAANYTIRDSNFEGGPNQVVDQTWTPLLYGTRGHAGCCAGGGGAGTMLLDNTQWNRRGFYSVTNGGGGPRINAMGQVYSQGGITPRFTVQSINGNVAGGIEIDNMQHDTEAQATYAWICNISCSAGFGVPFHLGFANAVSQDTGTIPQQLTGGGNQPIMQVVGAMSPGGTNINTAFGNVAFGSGWTVQNGVLVPTLPISFINGTFPGNDIRPNVPTPQLSLESGAFLDNLTAPLTATRNVSFPDASGTVCLTTSGCLPVGYVDTGAANAYAIATVPPTTGYVNGAQFYFQAVHANTATSTLNVNGLGAITIKKNGGTGGSVGSNLASGDIAAGQWVYVVYDGTNFQIQSTLGNASGGGSGTVGNCANAPAVAYYSGAGTTVTCLNLPAFMQYIYAADSGVVNAYVVNPPTAATLVTGAQIAFTTVNANTGASTINVSSLGVLALTKYGATALVAGDILANTYYKAVYDGTEWQVVNPSAPQANVVLKNATNAFTAAGTLDLSASTNPNGLRMPNISGGVTTLNGAEVYNPEGNIHVGANNVDNIMGIVPASVTLLNADCTQWSVTGLTKTLTSAGSGGCTLLNANNVAGASFRLNMSAATNANSLVLPNQGGAAPTVAGGTGFDTTNLQPVISDGTVVCPYAKEQVNAQSGSGYTVLASDCGKLVSVSNAGAQTLTLPASIPSKGWFIDVENTGTGTWTIAPNGNNLDGGASSTTIATNQGMRIASNGVGYFSMRGVGGGGGGSSNVNPAPQFSIGYYANPGSSSVIGGALAPSSPNGVPQFWTSTPSGGVPGIPTPAPAGVLPRTVSGTSDTIVATDRAGEVLYTSGSAVAVTLPQAGSAGFASNFVFVISYTGQNILTITPTTSTINGSATLTLGVGDFCFIYSDNANYTANCTDGFAETIAADTGSANAYAVAFPLVQTLVTGSNIFFTAAHANTTASTIAVNGLTTKNLTKAGNASLIANDVITGKIYWAVYDGTQWELMNPSNGELPTFTAHKWLGNGSASTAVAAPNTIGSSDISPNWYAADSGAANAYVVAPSPAITALTTGVQVNFSTTNANSGASTINVSGLGIKALDKLNVAALVSGDILSGAIYSAVYDGTEWILLDPSTGSGSGTVANCTTAHSVALYNAAGTTVSCFSESNATQYLYAADSGAVNAYVITLAPALTSLVTGEQAYFTTTNANTGASTINVNGLGVKNITKLGATALVATDITASTVYEIVWDGTEWQLINPSTVTATTLLASGIVDGKAPVTVTTTASCTLGTGSGCNATAYNSGYTFNEDATAAAAITYTLPTAAAGKQYCVKNAFNGSAANTGTLELLTSAAGQFIIFTDGTLSATGGFVISGGAAADAACVVGVDATHWILYVQSGNWTKH